VAYDGLAPGYQTIAVEAAVEESPAPEHLRVGGHPAASVIDASSSFEGVAETGGDLQVAGSVVGDILCHGTLTVADGAESKARVRAGAFEGHGEVDGELRCSGRARFASTAVVRAHVRAAALAVDEGASVSGLIETGPVSLDEEWPEAPGVEAGEAYCVRCKAKRPVTGAEEVTLRNGRAAVEGTCAVCGTKVFRMLGGGAKAAPASASLW
jgi:cytoskeletal protein CcmA (bactofilin family)